MNILMLAMGQDTGGVLSGIRRAFRAEAGWSVHTLIATPNYIQYERDLAWTMGNLRRMWKWADVVHVQHRMVAIERLTSGWRGFRMPKRHYVVSFHGTGFREDPQTYLDQMEAFGAVGVCSTLDLWLLAPDKVDWQPNPSSVDTMQDLRRRHKRKSDVVRIAHAPTNREVKDTEAFLEAVKQLQAEGLPVELDLIEGASWADCLRRKATADIYYDQVQLGYGNNAIEAWGMGIPVIAGAQPATLAEMERRFGSLPFYNTTQADIYSALKALVQSKDLRAEYSEKGLAHVRRFHDEKVVVEQLKRLYRKAAGIEEQAA